MPLIAEEVPIQALVMVPFPPLSQFTPHEEQFLARLGLHVAQKKPQIGELLPIVPGHLAQE